jgi:hypothetical protein
MTLTGRLTMPIFYLTVTLAILLSNLKNGTFLNFQNANNILSNYVILIFSFLTFITFFFLSRKIYIDSEKLVVVPPPFSWLSPKEIILADVRSYKIRSTKSSHYLITFYFESDKGNSKLKKKNVVFNLKNSDFDILQDKLKSLNLNQ